MISFDESVLLMQRQPLDVKNKPIKSYSELPKDDSKYRYDGLIVTVLNSNTYDIYPMQCICRKVGNTYKWFITGIVIVNYKTTLDTLIDKAVDGLIGIVLNNDDALPQQFIFKNGTWISKENATEEEILKLSNRIKTNEINIEILLNSYVTRDNFELQLNNYRNQLYYLNELVNNNVSLDEVNDILINYVTKEELISELTKINTLINNINKKLKKFVTIEDFKLSLDVLNKLNSDFNHLKDNVYDKNNIDRQVNFYHEPVASYSKLNNLKNVKLGDYATVLNTNFISAGNFQYQYRNVGDYNEWVILDNVVIYNESALYNTSIFPIGKSTPIGLEVILIEDRVYDNTEIGEIKPRKFICVENEECDSISWKEIFYIKQEDAKKLFQEIFERFNEIEKTIVQTESKLESDIKELHNKLELEIKNITISLLSKIVRLSDDTSEVLKELFDDFLERTKGIDEEVKRLNDTLQKQVEELAVLVNDTKTELKTEINNIKTELEKNISDTKTELNGKISSLQGEIKILQDGLVSLEERVKVNETDIFNLTEQVITNTDDIKTTHKDLTSLKNDFDKVENNHETRITALEDKIYTDSSSISISSNKTIIKSGETLTIILTINVNTLLSDWKVKLGDEIFSKTDFTNNQKQINKTISEPTKFTAKLLNNNDMTVKESSISILQDKTTRYYWGFLSKSEDKFEPAFYSDNALSNSSGSGIKTTYYKECDKEYAQFCILLPNTCTQFNKDNFVMGGFKFPVSKVISGNYSVYISDSYFSNGNSGYVDITIK